MNVREALEKLGGRISVAHGFFLHGSGMLPVEKAMVNDLAPEIERALRAAWHKGLADSHRLYVNSDSGITAGVAEMVEEK